MTAALGLAAALTLLCILGVALPYLREPAPESDLIAEPGGHERRQLERAEIRDRALAALKELEFDHRTGKVSDEDYRALIGPLRRDAVQALRDFEPGQPDGQAASAAAAGSETAET